MAPTVLCVVGPTASGKTKMGVLLARRFGGEVISMDSMQIYRGMVIGTAAPTPEETEGVPHHMVAVADPRESWSVARFTEEADRCIRDVLGRGKLPILVGGSGQYLDAVVKGLHFAPGAAGGEIREKLEQELREKGVEPLLEELRRVDPAAAARLHPADEKRILRALEVYRETGKTITEHNEATAALPDRYRALYIGLAFRDREDMKARIDRRVDQMVDRGLVEEIQSLLRQGIPPNATALQAIGYKEFLSALRGERSLEEAAAEVKLRSRQYAKRQLTWLRRNQSIHWIYWDQDPSFDLGLQDATEYLTAQGLQ